MLAFATAAVAPSTEQVFTLHLIGNYTKTGASLVGGSTQTFVFVGPHVGATQYEQSVGLGSGASLQLTAKDGPPPSFEESGVLTLGGGNNVTFSGAGFTQKVPSDPTLTAAVVNYVITGGNGIYKLATGVIAATAVLSTDGTIDYYMQARVWITKAN